MLKKLEKIAEVLRSGIFIDTWSVLLFAFYSIPGFYKYSKEASLMPVIVLSIVLSLITWGMVVAYKRVRYEDFSFKGYAKQLPRMIIVCLFFCGYILNYQYSNQSPYQYAIPVYGLVFMSICALICRKIYFRKMNRVVNVIGSQAADEATPDELLR